MDAALPTSTCLEEGFARAAWVSTPGRLKLILATKPMNIIHTDASTDNGSTERPHPDGNDRCVERLLTCQDQVRRKTTSCLCGDEVHAFAHSSEAIVSDSPAGVSRISSDRQSNSSRSQDRSSLSNPAPCELSVNGSRCRSKAAKWCESDVTKLLETVEPCKDSAGRINHKLLQTKWDMLKHEGVVSNVNRSANALIAKYKECLSKDAGSTRHPDLTNTQAGPVLTITQAGDSTPAQSLIIVDREEPALVNVSALDGMLWRDGDSSASGLQSQSTSLDLIDSSEGMEFQRQFEVNLRLAAKAKRRVALRLARNRRIPPEWLQLGNLCISRYCKEKPLSLGRLNLAVYASAKTIIDRITGPPKEADKEWYGKNADKRRVLCRYLGMLSSIVRTLKTNRELTPNQRHNLKTLKRIYGDRYKLRTIEQQEVLYLDLTTHLEKCQLLLKTRFDEKLRKQSRWAPLSSVLRKGTGAEETPVEAVRDYWERVIGIPSEFQMNPMLRSWESAVLQEVAQKGATLSDRTVDRDEWEQVCKKAKSFKATGPDCIHTFWWKVFPSAKEGLFQIIRDLSKNPHKGLPRWLTKGRAVSLYKGSGNLKDPGNYRTIACLNTCYKLVTGMMARWLRDDITELPTAMPQNQVALQKGMWATTHAHILDRTIVKDAVSHKGRQLHIAWIDFAKAFDSVPHGYINWILEALGVKADVRVLLAGFMSQWELTFTGFEKGRLRSSSPLRIRNGVLQGDTLSPLLFCLSVSPISHYLNTEVRKYITSTGTIGGRVTPSALSLNHLYYVDDLVIYSPDSKALDQALRDIDTYAKGFNCRLNARKSAVYHIGTNSQNGSVTDSDSIHGASHETVPTMRVHETYKYLGIEKSRFVDHAAVWDRVRTAVLNKVHDIMSSYLTFRQKVNAFNAITIPKAKYLFSNEIYGQGRFESVLAEADRLDQEIRTQLVALKVHHRSCCRARLYIDPKQGGLGFKLFRLAVYESIIYTYCYMALRPELKTSWILMETLDRRGKRTLLEDFRKSLRDSLDNELVVFRDPLQFTLQIGECVYTEPTKAARAICDLVWRSWQSRLEQEFKNLPHASRVTHNDQLDQERSYLWLQKGLLSSEIVNNAIAAQEGQLLLKGHPSRKENYGCRLSCSKSLPARETAEHILTVCPHWRTTLMVKRHNSVARNIYYALCVKYGFETRHFNQTIEGRRKVGPIELYWDHPLVTTTKVAHHRPDIVVIDRAKKTVMVIEVSVSWQTRLDTQEKRKYAKYAVNSTLPEGQELDSNGTFPVGDNLATELGRDHGCVVTVLPLIVGALGEVSHGLVTNLAKLDLPRTDVLLERICRSAVIGSAIIIKAHCSVPQNR